MTESQVHQIFFAIMCSCVAVLLVSLLLVASSLIKRTLAWSFVVAAFGTASVMVFSVDLSKPDGQAGLAIPIFFVVYFISAVVGSYLGIGFKRFLGRKL